MRALALESPVPDRPLRGNERMTVVLAGHVDHGKSTLVGRLLADTGALPDGKLEQVRATCARTSKPFEYAFLLDALKDEQAQGITIDAARVFFRGAHREYVLLDAPGHVEFLKNMVTGASRAEGALLVIDAREGVQENSRRHGYLVSMLGVRELVVVVNKMDLVDWDEARFAAVKEEYARFLAPLGVVPQAFIPASGREGDNLATRSGRMDWYSGPTVLEALDRMTPPPPPLDAPFRMWIQDVYKFTEGGDQRRIVAGTIDAGALSVGDEVLFLPSGKRAHVEAFQGFAPLPERTFRAGGAVGFTTREQIYVPRGELAVRSGEVAPRLSNRVRANVFWLGHAPLEPTREVLFRMGSAKVGARLVEVHRLFDADLLAPKLDATRVQRHQVAECTFELAREIPWEPVHQSTSTGRFVLVDEYEIRGGGIVREPEAADVRPAPAQASAEPERAPEGQAPPRPISEEKGAVGTPWATGRDSSLRSMVKAFSWRVLSTLITALLVWILSGEVELALLVGGIEAVVKIFVYFAHERLWDRIRFGKKVVTPKVIWLTGLSGAGKSTLAVALADTLAARGLKVERLDGDTVRKIFPQTGFSRPERDAHVRRVGFLASQLEKHGIFVVAAFISPYEESREFVRSLCKGFVEVHVATPLEVCEARDVKGLYAKARRGELKNFTGLDDPYEPPSHPELELDTTALSVDAAVERIVGTLSL